MKDIFAPIYETWFQLYSSDFSLIFNTLYDDGGYVWLGITFSLLPFVLMALFYFVWRYPYGKFWHWLIWLIFISLAVIGLTWETANSEIFASNSQALNDALADPDSGYKQFAETLPIKYALVNGGLSALAGFFYSLIFKQFSKIQVHLPF